MRPYGCPTVLSNSYRVFTPAVLLCDTAVICIFTSHLLFYRMRVYIFSGRQLWSCQAKEELDRIFCSGSREDFMQRLQEVKAASYRFDSKPGGTHNDGIVLGRL